MAASSPLWVLKSISAEKHSMQALMVWLLPKFSTVHLQMLPGSAFSFPAPLPCSLLPPLAVVASAVAAQRKPTN